MQRNRKDDSGKSTSCLLRYHHRTSLICSTSQAIFYIKTVAQLGTIFFEERVWVKKMAWFSRRAYKAADSLTHPVSQQHGCSKNVLLLLVQVCMRAAPPLPGSASLIQSDGAGYRDIERVHKSWSLRYNNCLVSVSHSLIADTCRMATSSLK